MTCIHFIAGTSGVAADLLLRCCDQFSNMYNGLALPHCHRCLLYFLTSVSLLAIPPGLVSLQQDGQSSSLKSLWDVVLTKTILNIPYVERKRLPNIMV